MKVQIKEKLSGKIKTVTKRDADILVKLNRAEYVAQDALSNSTYQTKVMTAATPPAASTAATGDISFPAKPSDADDDTANTSETGKNTLASDEETEDNTKPKRRGRPAKDTYETKVMTAKD